MFASIFLPLAAGLLLGIIFGSRPGKIKNHLINFILYFIIPLLVLQIMWQANLEGRMLLIFAVAATCTSAVGIIVSLVLSVFLKQVEFRDAALPTAFMNSGNLGIPAAGFAFGSAGLAYAVVFNAFISLLIFTAGVAIVSRKEGIKEIFRIPVIYALAVGIVLNVWGPAFPSSAGGFELFKDTAMFLMLALVGWRLSFLNIFAGAYIFWISAGRFAAGIVGSALVIFIFELPAFYAAPVILLSMMPSAVNSYILAEKYNSSPHLASGAIALTTIVFLVVFSLAV